MFTRLCYGVHKDMPFNYSKFICDYISDLETLPTTKICSSINKDIKPCSVGSVAEVLEDKCTYVLSNENTWVKFISNGSSSELDGNSIATQEEIERYLSE